MSKKLEVIKCPVCGAEYLPAEIYLPHAFLGKPSDIEKDHIKGTLRNFSGKSMDTSESYRCDYCNTLFDINAKVHFTTNESKANPTKPYKTQIRKQQFVLDENT